MIRAALLLFFASILLNGCGKDNFFVSITGCDNPNSQLSKCNCSEFDAKPWFYGLDEMAGFHVFQNVDTDLSTNLLNTFSDAKASNKYVAVCGDSTQLLEDTLENSLSQIYMDSLDISGLVIQIHAETPFEEDLVNDLNSLGAQASFHELQ